MAHHQQREYCLSVKRRHPELFQGVRVLDIGSLDINGNNRFLFQDYSYTGVDIGEGPNVDVVCRGHEHYSSIPYDVSISTECLEHDEYWSLTLQNMYALTRPGGLMLMTCATTGRREHGTRRSSPGDAPFVGDYYQNLTEQDVRQALEIESLFQTWEFKTNSSTKDLYFYGIKNTPKEDLKDPK